MSSGYGWRHGWFALRTRSLEFAILVLFTLDKMKMDRGLIDADGAGFISSVQFMSFRHCCTFVLLSFTITGLSGASYDMYISLVSASYDMYRCGRHWLVLYMVVALVLVSLSMVFGEEKACSCFKSWYCTLLGREWLRMLCSVN
ncbi:hypothetical protein CsSME_00031994 [Camellia sinensis var. sinensis]